MSNYFNNRLVGNKSNPVGCYSPPVAMGKKEERYDPMTAFRKQEKQKKKKDAKDAIRKAQKKHKKARISAPKQELNPEDYESFGGSKLLIEKYSSDESDEEGLEDLDGVPVPSGVAPDTQGQIYKALTQLTVVKNIGWVKEQRKLAKSKHEKVPTSQPQPASEIPKHFPGMPWSQTEHRVETTTIKSSIDAAKLALYASSSAVVAAAPQLRDLVKEAVVMVPASVQRRRIEREANQ